LERRHEKSQLNKEEQDILGAFEVGEFKSVMTGE
jgi:hypothetical protein